MCIKKSILKAVWLTHSITEFNYFLPVYFFYLSNNRWKHLFCFVSYWEHVLIFNVNHQHVITYKKILLNFCLFYLQNVSYWRWTEPRTFLCRLRLLYFMIEKQLKQFSHKYLTNLKFETLLHFLILTFNSLSWNSWGRWYTVIHICKF